MKSIKSIDRISAVMGLVIAAIGMNGAVKDGLVDHLGSFLDHRFPRVSF